MNRNQLVRQLAVSATRPVAAMHQPVSDCTQSQNSGNGATELFVWFEDTESRVVEGRRGIAGLPESLLPCGRNLRVVERRFAENHLHLLCAVRIAVKDGAGELIASLYTAALSVGTVAWIGTGAQYARTWHDMYPALLPAVRPE